MGDRPTFFASLLRPYRTPIARALGLDLVQQLAWIVEPFVFGRAIDALIAHHVHESLPNLVLHLSIWIGVFALNSGAGAIRMVYAKRVHGELYRDLCGTLARRGAERAEPAARTAARGELFQELVVFLDEQAPVLLAAIVNLAGSVIALTYFDARIALACLGLGLPILSAQQIVQRRVAAIQREEHDLRERNVDVYASADPGRVTDHFDAVSRARIRAARWSALNFGVLRVFLVGIFVTVLYVGIDLDSFTTGAIYSIVSYLWTFVAYAEDIPKLFEIRASLRDLQWRVSRDVPEAGTAEPVGSR